MLLPHPPLELPSSSKTASIAALASPSRRNHYNLAEKQRTARADQEQIWRDLLANPSLWWDNRYDKLGRGHPDFRHKISRQPLWLNSHRKPTWVDREKLDSFNHGRYAYNCSVFEDLVKKFHGICRVGRLDVAIDMLFNMPFHPTENMYYALLKVCNDRKALAEARLVQSRLSWDNLEIFGFLGEYLVITLVKCGGIEDALYVFNRMPHRTVFCWTAIISGYVECGNFHEALSQYPLMLGDGIDPNDFTFVCLLKACGSLCDLEGGNKMHIEVKNYNYGCDLFVGTSLIDMYAKCGSIMLAKKAFDGLLERNVVSWTALLSAYAEHGQPERTLGFYDKMQEEGVSPDDRAFVIALQACYVLAEDEGSLGQDALRRAQALHANAWIKSFDSDVFVGNALVSLYGKCGKITEAENVFAGLPIRDIVSWNALLFAYVEEGWPHKALRLFRQLKEEGVAPDDRTFVSSLLACVMLVENDDYSDFSAQSTKLIAVEIGRALHFKSRLRGFDTDLYVSHTLVNLYGSCGTIAESENAFIRLREYSVVSWTVMCLAYLKQDEGVKALQLYKEMQDEGIAPNDRTITVALQACCSLAEKEATEGHPDKAILHMIGKALHADAQRTGFDLDAFVSSALVIMYEKCGGLEEANNTFSELSKDHVAPWNAMLSACIERDEGHKVLELYGQMQERGIEVTDTTLLYALQACSKTGSLEICREIHNTLVAAGLESKMSLVNTFIHAYGFCASIADAHAVFNLMPTHDDVASWNTLIGGYAQEGNWATSLLLYEKMKGTFVKPDGVTFTSILTACCHGGLVEKGIDYLASMSRDYSLSPEIGHYSTVLDLLGKAGDFVRVRDLLSSMPIYPNLAMWLGLLGACQMHGNVKLARHAYNEAVHLQPKQAIANVLVLNIYADADPEVYQVAMD